MSKLTCAKAFNDNGEPLSTISDINMRNSKRGSNCNTDNVLSTGYFNGDNGAPTHDMPATSREMPMQEGNFNSNRVLGSNKSNTTENESHCPTPSTNENTLEQAKRLTIEGVPGCK